MALAFRPIDPIEDVLNRLAHFRRVAFGVRSDFEADLCDWFGLNAGQSRLLAVLYEAEGPLRPEALMCAANLQAWSLGKYVARIREALGEGTLPARGSEGVYQLTQLGRAACDEAVANVGMNRARELLEIAR